MRKKEWERGEKADFVAKAVRAYLVTNLRASITDLCTVVQKEISRKKHDIQMSPSILRSILVVEKRPFCLVRVPGEGMHVTLTRELLLDIIKEMSRNVRNIKTSPGLQGRHLARA